MSIERMFPQNIEAEQGVLGSCIIDPSAIAFVADFLKPEHFHREANRTIYTIILNLYEQMIPADFITISDQLERQGTFDQVGGPGYLASLITGVPTSGNVEYYGRIVWNTWIQRQLIRVGGEIVTLAYSEVPASVALEQAETKIYDIGQERSTSDFHTGTDTLLPVWNTLLEVCTPGKRGTLTGVPSGFHDLDYVTGGFQSSDLIILAARPGVGKTSFAMTLAKYMTMILEKYIAVFSLEMSGGQLMQRLLSMVAGVDLHKLRTGWVEDDEWVKLELAMRRLSTNRLWIDDTSAISLTAMRSKLRRLMAKYPIEMIFVDYLQLMTGASKGNRVEVVGEITAGLKAIAKDFNIPVMALAQLSRTVESRASKVPQLSDLRESGSCEQDADIVLFIYRDELYNPESERKNIADIIVAKHRNGDVGEVSLHFEKRHTEFSNLEVRV